MALVMKSISTTKNNKYNSHTYVQLLFPLIFSHMFVSPQQYNYACNLIFPLPLTIHTKIFRLQLFLVAINNLCNVLLIYGNYYMAEVHLRKHELKNQNPVVVSHK